MTEERIKRLEEKLDRMAADQQKLLAMIGSVLVEADHLTKAKGLNKNTISQNDKLEKYNQIGKRKLLLKLESVPVIRNRKRSQKRNK